MNIKFNDLEWHDAELLSIFINRRNPGKSDSIELQIRWPETNNTSLMTFQGCYAFNAKMNFGVIACESILYATCIVDSLEVKIIQEKWLKIGVKLPHLKCYSITTNSTNSVIEVFACDFHLQDIY